MREFRDIVLAYGESDEYSFVFQRSTALYGDPATFQWLVMICCCALPIHGWKRFLVMVSVRWL